MSNVIDLRPETIEKEMQELNERIVKLGKLITNRDDFEKSIIHYLSEINENTFWTGKLLQCLCDHFKVYIPPEK